MGLSEEPPVNEFIASVHRNSKTSAAFVSAISGNYLHKQKVCEIFIKCLKTYVF